MGKRLLAIGIVGGLAGLAFVSQWAMIPFLVGLVGGAIAVLLFVSVPVLAGQGEEELKAPLEAFQGEEDFLAMAEELGFAAKQLLWNANESVSAAQNLVSLATDVALNSTENAASLEECTAGVEELLSAAEELDAKTGETSADSHRSLEKIKESQDIINKVGSTLTEIAEEVLASARVMEELQATSRGIGDFVVEINKIADQTNLLALNATIEAARAGEAGRGFAVVAGEVNKLSQESGSAAKNIAKTVRELSTSIMESGEIISAGMKRITGVEEITRSSGLAMEKIIRELEGIAILTEGLSQTAAIQTETTRELAQAIEDITSKTEKSSLAAEETAKILRIQETANRELVQLSRVIEKEANRLQGIASSYRTDSDLIFGVTPLIEPQKVKERYGPIINGIAGQLEMQGRTIITSDYGALAQCLLDGVVDIGWFSPLAYVSAREQGEVIPLVTPIVNGAPSYEGYIITRKDSGINTLDDLRGVSFAFVDPKSASGYAYPRFIMKEAGLDPDKDLKEVLFMGTHNKVIEAVLAGNVVAGATFVEAWDLASEHGLPVEKELTIIARTEPIPKDALAAGPKTNPDLLDKLQQAFVVFKDTPIGREVLADSPIDGFIPADDDNYNIVRQVAALDD